MRPARTFLTSATGIMLAAVLLAPAAFAQVTDISVADAHQMWLDGNFALVLDVRSAGEFEDSHIPNAYLIPVSNLSSRIDEIIDYQNDPVLVYCGSGARSTAASNNLAGNHGFTNVYNMRENTGGSFSVWIAEGYETAVVVVFGDPHIDGEVRAIIGKPEGEDIRSNELVGAGLTNLTATNIDPKITDLSGLEYCSDLVTIDFSQNAIVDLSPLSNLANLTTLTMYDNQIVDIEVLANLENLSYIRLDNNDIDDISALEDLEYLSFLRMNNNLLDDLSPLAELIALETMELFNNEIVDIGPLENLVNLTSLMLGGNQIEDVSPLENLTNMDSLDLSSNPIADISTLDGLTALTYLKIFNAQVTDISALEDMTLLSFLMLRGNLIEDISPLDEMTELTDLNLADNFITDISALENLVNIEQLELQTNEIGDISVLTSLTALSYLDLSYNVISDAGALVYNLGIDTGDVVYLQANPLSQTTLCDDIPVLEGLLGDDSFYVTGACDADQDDDDLADEYENNIGTLSNDEDTDDDGLLDGEEVVIYRTDPRDVDTDGDGLNDGVEIGMSLDPTDADSDDDGMPDGWEVGNGLNPTDDTDGSDDPDGDGLPNSDEFDMGGDPGNPDTDGDGLVDGSDALPNDAPPSIGATIPGIETEEDDPTVFDLTQYETDREDSDAGLTWEISGVDSGLFTATILESADSLNIEPVADAYGSDQVTLTLVDSQGQTDSQQVTVTIYPVNDAPACSQPSNIEFDEDMSDSTLDLDDIVTDIDNDIAELSWDYAATEHVTVSIDEVSHEVTFGTEADWYGSESVTLICTDPDDESDTTNVLVVVRSVNDPPWIEPAVPDIEVEVNGSATFDLTPHENDVDNNNELRWEVNDVDTSLFVATIHEVENEMTITPLPDVEGSDQIELVLSDGGVETASQWITVTVTPFVQSFPEGDVNHSETVDAVDIQLVINAVLGLDVDWNCDIDGDGNVTAVDIQLAINAVLGIV